MNIYTPQKRKALQYRFILPTHFKLLLIILTVLFSLYSGAAQAQQSTQEKTVFVKQISTIPGRRTATVLSVKRPESLLPVSPVRQLSVITIVNKVVVPTATPVPVLHTQAVSQQEGKSSPVSSYADLGMSAAAGQFLNALNAYRQKNGKAPLSWDGKLGKYAQERADQFNRDGKLDFHAGFNDFIHNQDGFHKLGYYSLGENSGYGHTGDPVSIIENSYGHSPAHNENQLNPDWSSIGIGVSGSATDFIFGGHKM